MAVSDWDVHIDPDRVKELEGKARLGVVMIAHIVSAMSNQARNELSRAARNPFTHLVDVGKDTNSTMGLSHLTNRVICIALNSWIT